MPETTWANKITEIANICAVFLVGIATILVIWFFPAYHWDMIPYAAAVFQGNLHDTEIHTATWDVVRANVPDHQWAILRGETGSWREQHYTDPELLLTVLPLYDSKIGYVYALKYFSLVLDPIQSMKLVNGLCAACMLFIFFAATRDLPNVLKFLWLPLMGLFDFLGLMRFESPDAIGVTATLASFFFFMERRLQLGAGLLLIAIVIRPDNIVLGAFVFAALFPVARILAVISMVAAVSIYLTNSYVSDHIGWWGQFYYTLVETPLTLVDFDPPFDSTLYLSKLLSNTIYMLTDEYWAYAALLIMILCFGFSLKTGNMFAICLPLAVFIAFIAKFIIFPFPTLRLYGPNFFGLSLLLCMILSQTVSKEALWRKA